MKSLLQKHFSARGIRRQSTVTVGNNDEPSTPTPISVANSSPDKATEEQLEQKSHDIGDGSNLCCHGMKWKAVGHSVLKTGDAPLSLVHILWGSDIEVVHGTPLDYWKWSFPLQMLPAACTVCSA